MVDLVVSTWNRPSQAQQELASLQVRFMHLRHAVEMTARKIAEKQFDADGLIRGIFVAPEYLFAARNAGLKIAGVTQPRAMSSARHDLVIKWLTSLSERHPRILIVPGTIAWETPFGTSKEFKSLETYLGKAKYQPIPEPDLLKQFKTAWFWDSGAGSIINWSDLEEYKEQFGSYPAIQSLLDITIQDVRKNSPAKYDEMRLYARLVHEMGIGAVRRMHKMVPLNPKRFMFNTAYGFLNGKIVLAYRKQGNFNEEAGYDDIFFLSGGQSGFRDIEGIRFGFEVCLDHNIGLLKRQLRPGQDVDVQIVLSDSVRPVGDNIVVQDGGFFVHASTDGPAAGCFMRNGATIEFAPEIGTETVAGSELHHWKMHLDVYDPFDLSDSFMTRLGKPDRLT